jgi:Nucleotide modification associated domain 2
MSRVYMYVVDRDFGFAPNPFHGVCTLATCKPGIRSTAQVGDWVVGMGGKRLDATGCCIFAMQVSEKITFDEYWSNPIYLDKKPVRNGSSKMLVGDNIYHWDPTGKQWQQADSHHSHPGGSPNIKNLSRDTKCDKVLISRHFWYFGDTAPTVPPDIIASIGFVNRVGHRVYDYKRCATLIDWLERTFRSALNRVQVDPHDFHICDKRFAGHGSKIV